jgi:AGZA family xanthine/uracil permease-like MFS transporter
MTSSAKAGAASYEWIAPGDLNAYFAFLLDCVVNLFVLKIILEAFGFPVDFIYSHIIPGGAMAIVVGNVIYSWLSFRTARLTGSTQITAIPLGLDITTIIGYSVGVLGPVFLVVNGELGDPQRAAEIAWYVGMAGTLWMALVKLICSFFGGAIRRFIPPAALIGSIMGIAIVWLGANSIVGVFEVPTVGLISFTIMAFALIAGHVLPFRIPGAVVGLALGTAVFYLLGNAGILDMLGQAYTPPVIESAGMQLPIITFAGFSEFFGRAITYLPLTIPFGVLVAASSINITEALRLAGDEYTTENVIRGDSLATAIGALCGSVIQTTPYFGHLTYKRMGARAAYSMAVTVTMFLGGVTGAIALLSNIIPGAVAKPILIVVAFDIVRLAFESLPARHAPAIAMATLPPIINFAQAKVDELLGHVQNGLAATSVQLNTILPAYWTDQYYLLLALSRGYIVTALLWAAAMAFIIDRQLREAAAMMGLAAVFTLFGFIHSLAPQGAIYLPWTLAETSGDLPATAILLPYNIALGYLLAAISLYVLSFYKVKTDR